MLHNKLLNSKQLRTNIKADLILVQQPKFRKVYK